MRILITTGIFKPELGGPATYAAELARRLASAGHTVAVITYADRKIPEIDAQFPFPIVRIVRRGKLSNYLRFFFNVLSNAPKYDFIYSLDWFSAGVPVWLAAKIRGKKYITRVGGGYIWEKYLAEGNKPLSLKAFYAQGLHKRYMVMYILIKKVLQNAERIVFNSNDQRELYQEHYKLDPSKVLTIFNPVPEHKFGTLLQTYNRPLERDKEIAFAGRFIKMKNVESLIQAFSKLEDKEFKLLLIGEGPTETELRSEVRKLGLENRVEFLPPMNQADLYRRLSNVYFVVIPSWTDISPNQAYECLALNIPFLISKENYLSINQKNLLRIDPASVEDIAEKMNLLLKPEEYTKFVESERTIEFHHGWNEVLRDHMKVFTQVIHTLQ